MGCLATQTSIHYSNPSALNPTMSSMYSLRSKEPKNYKTLAEGIKIPRCRRVAADKLYPITVVETHGDKVKIHYEGCGDEHDGEMRETLCSQGSLKFTSHLSCIERWLIKYKLALDSRGRRDPQGLKSLLTSSFLRVA